MYSGFPQSLLEKVKCPHDGGDLQIQELKYKNRFILEADIICSACPGKYYLRDGILDMLRSGPELAEEMKREVGARDDDAESYDEFTDQPWYKLEIPSTMSHLQDIDGKEIVEFGSGTGRITVELVKKAAGVIAVDFSRSSHQYLAGRIAENVNIGLVLGDVTKLRFAPESFDIAVSTQVLEHIPSSGLRRDFLKIVRDTIKPNGYFLCTAYYHDVRRKFRREPKEGFHDSGIFYHYFGRKELRSLFSEFYDIIHLHTFLSHVPKIWRLQLVFPRLIKLFDETPGLREFGSLILVKAAKRST